MQLISKKLSEPLGNAVSRTDLSAAFDPIAENPGSSNIQTNTLTASCFDREFRVITEEVAPYVRSIAEYDREIEIEKQRMLLSTDGPNPKRLRTSRVSRSALEGGRREEKRRDRWFTTDLNLKLVMETGGKEWSELRRRAAVTNSSTPASSNEYESQ
jgi:hypothetical protein